MKCTFTKPDGTKCEANAMNGGEFCYFHNPDISEAEKRATQTNGGKARALTISEPLTAIEITKPEDTINLLVDTINRVRAGTLDIRIANCLGFLSDKLLKAFEISNLNGRVEIIEQVIQRKTKY